MQQEEQEVRQRQARVPDCLSRILVRGWYVIAAGYLAVLLFIIAPPGHPNAWTLFALGNLLLGAYVLVVCGLLIALNPKGLRRMPRLSLVNVVGTIAVAAIVTYDSLSHLLPAGSLPHLIDLVPAPAIALLNGIGSFVFMVALVIVVWAYALHELQRSKRRSNPARRP